MEHKEVKQIIITELEKAEKIWEDVKDDIIKKGIMLSRSLNESYIPSDIPGYPLVKNGEGKVGEFIAMVLDIRKSSEHLLQAINNKKGVSQLQRVFYETTAINTVGLIIINENSGAITEFLGDGFLAIFDAKEKSDVYKPRKAAEDCLRIIKEIVNPILKERYDLPELFVGIGLAYSKAIVTVIGIEDYLFPKAIGECVYRASKLAIGYNEILFDNAIKNFWPSSKGGTIKFLEQQHKNSKIAKGYTLKRKDG